TWIVATPHPRVGDDAHAAGLLDEGDRVERREGVLLDVRAPAVADELVGVRVDLLRDDPRLDERLGDVGADDVLARGDLPDPLEAHRVSELPELLDHPLAAAQPALLQPQELGLELRIPL